jgi:hypothetical protein
MITARAEALVSGSVLAGAVFSSDPQTLSSDCLKTLAPFYASIYLNAYFLRATDQFLGLVDQGF